jgi:hypothetical protein
MELDGSICSDRRLPTSVPCSRQPFRRPMKLRSVVAILTLAGLSSLIVVRHETNAAAKKSREAEYQLALKTWSQRVKPGQTRGEVETEFRAHGTVYSQVMGAFGGQGFADLVNVGKEDHPWYCGENVVDIVFEFVPENVPETRPNSADVLKTISIQSMPGGCL